MSKAILPAPDYCEPLIGYRVWAWNEQRQLHSLYNGEPWLPYIAKQATCAGINHGLTSPEERCSCGIYAFSSLGRLLREMPSVHDGKRVFGEVALWGTVIEHEHGWRAEYAYPRVLTSREAAERYGVEYDDRLSTHYQSYSRAYYEGPYSPYVSRMEWGK